MPHQRKILIAIVLFLSALAFALNVFSHEQASRVPASTFQQASERTPAK